MANRQYFGLKYPFTNDGFQRFFTDTNDTEKDRARSEIMYIIFTPKGQCVRNPLFGTDLVKYIFDMNDQISWESVKAEISESVTRWSKNLTLKNIQVVKEEDDPNGIYVKIQYTYNQGNKVTNDSIVAKL